MLVRSLLPPREDMCCPRPYPLHHVRLAIIRCRDLLIYIIALYNERLLWPAHRQKLRISGFPMRFAYIALVMVLFGFSAQAEDNEPFGIATIPAPQNKRAADWRKVQDDWAVERRILHRCRAERERCSLRAALQLLTLIDEARIQTGHARLGYVNRAINLAIRPMNDIANYGVPETWKAPLATLAKGAGDCTDYAIAKYFALDEVGIPANDRRLVIVSIKLRQEEHAVLAVRENQHWMILDNQRMAIVNAADATEYIPLLVFDHRGTRKFVGPGLAQVTRTACPSGG